MSSLLKLIYGFNLKQNAIGFSYFWNVTGHSKIEVEQQRTENGTTTSEGDEQHGRPALTDIMRYDEGIVIKHAQYYHRDSWDDKWNSLEYSETGNNIRDIQIIKKFELWQNQLCKDRFYNK